MNSEAATFESQRAATLNQARRTPGASQPTAPVENVLSFGRKISEHWPLLAGAIFFDILALIPFLSIVFNLTWGGVLLLYFGPKGGKGGSEFIKIGLPVVLGSALDFIFSILPVNIGATLIRIALS